MTPSVVFIYPLLNFAALSPFTIFGTSTNVKGIICIVAYNFVLNPLSISSKQKQATKMSIMS